MIDYKEDLESFIKAQDIIKELINKYLHEDEREPNPKGRYDNVDKWISDFRTHLACARRKDFF